MQPSSSSTNVEETTSVQETVEESQPAIIPPVNSVKQELLIKSSLLRSKRTTTAVLWR